MPAQTTLFVGLGSSHGDDRVGWMVADALEPRLEGNAIVRHAVAPLDILNWLDGIERLAICDACQGIGTAGTWQRWLPLLESAPVVRARNSHDLGLPAAMQLASQLGILPREVLLWVVEIRQPAPGQLASHQVTSAIPAVVDDVVHALACRRAGEDAAASVASRATVVQSFLSAVHRRQSSGSG